jgi:hypothetical protein
MRRVPLFALTASVTSAVLLVGCQSAVAPVQPAPPPPAEQSLSFQIAGPSQIDANGSFSWEAFAFGGSGQYQYLWEVTRQAGQQITTSTGRELSLLVTYPDGDLVLTLTVTSGSQRRVESLSVSNCIGGCRK